MSSSDIEVNNVSNQSYTAYHIISAGPKESWYIVNTKV